MAIMLSPNLTRVPWQRFMDFIAPDADRLTILKETLKEAELEHKVTEIAGCRHIIVTPPSPEQVKSIGRRQLVILVAHYDRAEGSPGANDNSAGVFLLIETAMKLIKKNKSGWLVIFTDREELKSGEKLQSQGAYGLAEYLKNSKMEKPKIFSFDACGTGDTLIISTTLEFFSKKNEGAWEKLRDSILELRKYALDTTRNLNMAKVLLAPTPFSDDVGFIRAGLIAQTVTMLPSRECIQLVAGLRKNPEFADALINVETRQANRLMSIPDTWRSLNSPIDSYLRLTPENFRAVVRFAEALCSG
jgi:hypothetical protein